MIVAAAVKTHHDKKVHTLPAPARHHDVLHTFKLGQTPHVQGFVTDSNEFLNREDALKHAEDCGQVVQPKKTHPRNRLFSEDLW